MMARFFRTVFRAPALRPRRYYAAEALEPRRLLAGDVYSAWASPASVPEGQPASFFVKVDLPEPATHS